ncbi:acyl-CoA-binding protein [Gongronella butleri]|nr:acyl-CoA-binding protein [Gongronella butleri]
MADPVFESAYTYLNSHDIKVDNDTKLKFYAFYKQATAGDCATSKPGLFDFVARAKWDAWQKLKGTSSSAAMDGYISLLESLQVGWSRAGEYAVDAQSSQQHKEKGESDAKVFSTMANDSDDDSTDDDQDEIFSLVKDNKYDQLLALLKVDPKHVHSRDRNGLTALHHACDRGHLEAVKLLVEKGADINAVSKDDLETPLHFGKDAWAAYLS